MEDLFLHTLQDVYYAENQIVKSLPKMIEKATNRDLASALRNHLQETETQVSRLDQVFEKLGHDPKGTDCPAIDGLIKEEWRARSTTSRCFDAAVVRQRAADPALQDLALRHVDRLGAGARPATTTWLRCSTPISRRRRRPARSSAGLPRVTSIAGARGVAPPPTALPPGSAQVQPRRRTARQAVIGSEAIGRVSEASRAD